MRIKGESKIKRRKLRNVQRMKKNNVWGERE
jgi:hypothetical protein